MKIKNCLISVVLLFAIVLGCTGCSNNNDNNQLKTVRLCEVTHSIFYAPQYVAISEGFFKEEGINIELTNAGGSDKVMSAIISNNMDIGLAGPETCIYVYKEGNDDYPKMFGQLTKRDGSFLVSREDKGKFDWNDLKGKTVIPGRKGGVPYMTFEYVLKKNGLTPNSDVILDDSIQFDLMAGAFSSGKADYVTLFEPTASSVIDAKKGYLSCSIGSESGEIPYTGYIAKQSYMSKNSQLIEGFTRAVYKGQKWVREHSASEIAKSISSFFPDNDAASLEKSVDSYKNIDAWNETPVMTEEAYSNLVNVMTEAKELDKEVPFSAVIDNSFAEKILK